MEHTLGSNGIFRSHREENLTVKRELRYSQVTGTVRIVKTVALKQADQV
jgi:hypothetical protein